MTRYDLETLSRSVGGACVRVVAPRVTRRQRNTVDRVFSAAMETAVSVSETTIADPNGNYERFCVGVHGFGPNERWIMT